MNRRARVVRIARAALLVPALACAGTRTGVAVAPPAVATARAEGQPRLVVMLVIDQLREPYLEEYDTLFTGGFRRLLDHGRLYTRATHDHGVTETAAGHSTLATGVHPVRHGVVANAWSERTPAGWVEVENARDTTVRIVGVPAIPGVSPHNLERSGIADWLVAADPRAIVASVSGKDRGAVLPAGQGRGQVYWFDARAGRFVTSTYYRDRYPAWADAFTADSMPRFARDSTWESRIPSRHAALTSPDTAAWEGDSVHTWFPHRAAVEAKPGKFWDWWATTPMLDAATLAYARTMVSALGIGRDDVPDFLNVSLSQTDRIGHSFGPRSREELDNLLRLDGELATFFDFLDRTVGAGQWTVALAADHGAALAPETLPYPGEIASGHRATAAEKAQLREIREAAARAPDDSAAHAHTAAALRALPYVVDAYTHEELRNGTPRDSFAVFLRRSLYPGRAPNDFSPYGVEVRYVPGWLSGVRGSSHGTPYWYDRHVPMLFMGPGIAAGRDTTRVATTDFAPTLARLLGVPTPPDLDGHPLEVIR